MKPCSDFIEAFEKPFLIISSDFNEDIPIAFAIDLIKKHQQTKISGQLTIPKKLGLNIPCLKI